MPPEGLAGSRERNWYNFRKNNVFKKMENPRFYFFYLQILSDMINLSSKFFVHRTSFPNDWITRVLIYFKFRRVINQFDS